MPRIAALGLLCASLFFALFTWLPSDDSNHLATHKIENIRPGHRVIVDAPENAIVADAALLAGRDVNWNAGDGSGTVDGINDPLRAATDGSHSAIRRADYRLIHITAERVSASGDAEDIHVQTLQPLAWVEEHDVRRGGMAPLPIDMVELGLPEGMTGLVTAVLPCPTLQHGAGRLVITTMNSLSAETVELTVITPDGDLETLRPTAGHKFYSVSRGEWLDAWDLQDGEHLNGRHGTLTVADIRRLPGTRRVYNMTVQGLHFYRVGDSGVLVHNNVACGPKGGRHGDMPAPRPEGMESHHVIADAATDQSRADGAAVLMRAEDHALTSSYKNAAAVAKEREMLAQGRAQELFEKNIEEVLDIAKRQPDIPDDYYDEAAIEAWERFERQGAASYGAN